MCSQSFFLILALLNVALIADDSGQTEAPVFKLTATLMYRAKPSPNGTSARDLSRLMRPNAAEQLANGRDQLGNVDRLGEEPLTKRERMSL